MVFTVAKDTYKPTLAEDLNRWDICRHTLRGETGVYAFSAIHTFEGYRVTMDYWQDFPADEATEKTLLKAKFVPTSAIAVELIYRWIAEESERDYRGYQETQQAYRAVMLMTA